MMGNSKFVKETVDFFIFSTPISLHGDNFPIKFSFNKLLKIQEYLINLRLLFQQIDPNKFIKVINKPYIIAMFANR
jgi:hypothetical protein